MLSRYPCVSPVARVRGALVMNPSRWRCTLGLSIDRWRRDHLPSRGKTSVPRHATFLWELLTATHPLQGILDLILELVELKKESTQ